MDMLFVNSTYNKPNYDFQNTFLACTPVTQMIYNSPYASDDNLDLFPFHNQWFTLPTHINIPKVTFITNHINQLI